MEIIQAAAENTITQGGFPHETQSVHLSVPGDVYDFVVAAAWRECSGYGSV